MAREMSDFRKQVSELNALLKGKAVQIIEFGYPTTIRIDDQTTVSLDGIVDEMELIFWDTQSGESLHLNEVIKRLQENG